jgi:hypothetical protein
MQDFTGFEQWTIMLTIQLAGAIAGIGYVTGEDITELLESHGQQLCNGDLEEQAKEIRQQKEEKKEKDEESPLKCMKTSDLQCVLSAMDTLTMSSVKWTTSGSEVQKCKGV